MKRSSGSNSKAAKDREAEIKGILGILHKWGIHTLGQLAALDKEPLAARLGPEAVRMWERANGQSKRLLKLVQPPESFGESFEFENEIETAEPLFFMLRRFLEQLSLRLNGIYFIAKELILRITFANKQQYERCFKIPQPTNDVDLLFRMLQTHLENFKSEHPIIAVLLQAEPIKPNSQQFGLFETTLHNPHQLSETLARLTGLLGAERVGTPLVEETHRPDAFHLEPFSWNLNADTNATGPPHPPLSLRERRACDSTAVRESTRSELGPALRRFRPAVSASVFLSENIRAHFQSEKIPGKIADQRGPYLASGNWWDETTWVRAEWDVQLENGELVRAHEVDGTWEIDGVYD
jgi:protein ImuB